MGREGDAVQHSGDVRFLDLSRSGRELRKLDELSIAAYVRSLQGGQDTARSLNLATGLAAPVSTEVPPKWWTTLRLSTLPD
jgi:hypothetical protein